MLKKIIKFSLNSLYKYKCFTFSTINKEILKQNVTINMYNGVELNLEDIFSDEKEDKILYLKEFRFILENSIKDWETIKVRSIIVKIPNYLSNYISIFVDKGFNFHHTLGNNLIMTKWIENNTQNRIPQFAHHHIGVGACIINQNLDFLLIKERFSPLKNKKLLWKFVTGLVEEAESLKDAIKREAKEEVNLDIEYEGVLAISELYPNFHKISDLCFINLCYLKENDQKIKIQEDELSDAKFFNYQEVQKMIEEKEVTVLTIQTMNKIIPMIDFKKNLEENLKEIKGLYKMKRMETPTNYNRNIKYMNVFI